MFTIRQATQDDAQIVAALNVPVQQLHADARPHIFRPPSADAGMVAYYKGMLETPDRHIFIGEADGEPVGYLLARVLRRPANPLTVAVDSVYIDEMAVNPDRRGQGYGRKLVGAAVDLARAEGIPRVTLSVWRFNANAREFYHHLGFETIIESMELTVAEESAGEPPVS